VRRALAAPPVLAVLAVLCLLVSACSGVPRSSAPIVIGQVGAPSTLPVPASPEPGLDPRSIVQGFLRANVSGDLHHATARSYLTTAAKNRWSDSTVTIVSSIQIGIYDDQTHSVTVSGRQVGALDSSGVYSPALTGVSNGGDTVAFTFGLRQVDGEWRISALKNGLIITTQAFTVSYQQRPLYFFNGTNSQVVPDPRYSALAVPADLANWLVAGLVAGPSGQLENAVNTAVPAQLDPSTVTVTVGAVTTVEVPGCSKLDNVTRDQLAAQFALTLEPVIQALPMALTDGGRKVPIQAVSDTQFTVSEFSYVTSASASLPELYYLHNGAVLDSDAKPVPGPLGTSAYNLDSLAVGEVGSGQLLAAGTAPGPGTSRRLLVGTMQRGLRPTSLVGPLSRPSFVPGADEVWVGDGASLFRANSAGKISRISLSATNGLLIGQVSAVRLSLEGARVALVMSAPTGTAQIWIGGVVRSGPQVRVVGLQPISPPSAVVTDVTWRNDVKLLAIAHSRQAAQEATVYEVGVDGAQWITQTVENLPYAPDSITDAQDLPPWVSALGTVWTLRGNGWISPVGGTTYGTNPVYVE
jgi:hypothetical protein